ncbi:MAG: DUF4446 family protein [Candidatus Moranbacteria bacterium]|nr:DUF4446 family protein [Candidatus Moranbacteria bacterium]
MNDWVQSNITILIISTLSLGILAIVFGIFNLLQIRSINKRSELFFAGKDGQNLEALIASHSKSLKELDKEIQELFEISNKINALSFRGLHKIGVIRFNPFKDIGGDQSFAIALLDGKNSGIVISSLHTREGTRVYAKPVIRGESKKYPLTEEEKQAIKIASPIKEEKV